jgi:hypothetical protein
LIKRLERSAAIERLARASVLIITYPLSLCPYPSSFLNSRLVPIDVSQELALVRPGRLGVTVSSLSNHKSTP